MGAKAATSKGFPCVCRNGGVRCSRSPAVVDERGWDAYELGLAYMRSFEVEDSFENWNRDCSGFGC